MRFLLSACFCKVCACVSPRTFCSQFAHVIHWLFYIVVLLILSAEIVCIFSIMHLAFVLSCCMEVHGHSHNALPHADYGTALRTYFQANGALH